MPKREQKKRAKSKENSRMARVAVICEPAERSSQRLSLDVLDLDFSDSQMNKQPQDEQAVELATINTFSAVLQ